MNGYSSISEKGFRPGGGDHNAIGIIGKGITYLIKISGNLFMLDFKVRQRCVAAMAPIDDVVTLINQPLMIKLNKNLSDR